MTTLVTMPAPGAACTSTSSLPKKMCLVDDKVGASFGPEMKKVALSSWWYDMLAPVDAAKRESAGPFAKSTCDVEARAGLGGHAADD